MPLPDIAHETAEAPNDRRIGHAADEALGPGQQFAKQAIDRREIAVGELSRQALHDFEGDRRAQETDGRADTGAGRHDDARHAELFGEARGMERRRSAEGDERAAFERLAVFHRVFARRVRHRLVDHLDDAERAHFGRQR